MTSNPPLTFVTKKLLKKTINTKSNLTYGDIIFKSRLKVIVTFKTLDNHTFSVQVHCVRNI